jgi:hypothetical protein
MESIIIYPENEKQQFLLKSLLEEMKIRFKIEKSDDETLLSKNEFVAKIEKSIKEAESGLTVKLTKNQQKDLLGL